MKYAVEVEVRVKGEDRTIWVTVYPTDDLEGATRYARSIEHIGRPVRILSDGKEI